MKTIEPTVGRVVLFRREGIPGDYQPLAATISYVHSDTMINISFFGANGEQGHKTSVRLLGVNEERINDEECCHWMPYQIEQFKKQEESTDKAAPEEEKEDDFSKSLEALFDSASKGYVDDFSEALAKLFKEREPDAIGKEEIDAFRKKMMDQLGGEEIFNNDFMRVVAVPCSPLIEKASKSFWRNRNTGEGKLPNDVSSDHIVSIISRADFDSIPNTTTTICSLTTENGSVVVGYSESVAGEFDEEKGRNLAYEDAFHELWKMENYLLKQRHHEAI